MSREATSKQSSIREGAGYDKIFQSCHEPEEGFSRSLEWESFAHSPDDELEIQVGEEVEGDDDNNKGGKDEEYVREDDGDEGEGDEGAFRSPSDGHTCPFILPKIWTVNDFYRTMTSKIFNNLRDRFQIPNNIPNCLPGKYKKCYSGKTVDFGMYHAMFAAGLRLPLMALYHQLASYLGLSISQIASNA